MNPTSGNDQYFYPQQPAIVVPGQNDPASETVDQVLDPANPDSLVEPPAAQENDSDPAWDRRSIREPDVRIRRRRFTLGCTFLTIGLLVASFSIPSRNNLLAPGPLTSNHAQLLNGEGTDRCAHCHAAGNRTFLTWVSDTLTGGQTISQPQSELCLKCHQDMMSNETAMLAHNLTTNEIDALTEKYLGQIQQQTTNRLVASRKQNHGQSIACAKCHQEHHGADHDLAAMTDQQCQSCHKHPFQSFESGHPEFTNDSNIRRSRIAFDHATHLGKHFPASKSEFACQQCHVDDSFQNVKLLAPFAQSCGQCHDQRINDSLTAGLNWISLPMIDRSALESFKIELGQWPESNVGDFDGKIPLLAQPFLIADPKARPAFERLLKRYGTDFEFADIDFENEEEVKAAAEIAWAIKSLLLDLAQNPKALKTRLANYSPSIPKETIDQLIEQLDELPVQRALLQWLPHLEQEIKQYRGFASPDLKARVATYSKSLDDEILAENPLAKLMPPKTDKPDNDQTATDSRSPDAKRPDENNPNIRVAPRTPAIPGKIKNDFYPNSSTQDSKTPGPKSNLSTDDLLAPNPLTELMKKGNSESAAGNPPTTNPLDPATHQPGQDHRIEPGPKVFDNGTGENMNSENSIVDPAVKANQSNLPSTERLLQLMQEASARKSGIWFEDHQTFSIKYRPVGHADPFMKATIEFAAHAVRHDPKSSLSKLLQPSATGQCASCHTIDHVKNSSDVLVNWKAVTRDPTIRSFTNFSHRPHLLNPQTSDCQICHRLSPDQSNQWSFVGFDPAIGRSNFEPIQKIDCMSCHQKDQASNSCTTCHSYHIGTRIRAHK